jgi:hypothetical protein
MILIDRGQLYFQFSLLLGIDDISFEKLFDGPFLRVGGPRGIIVISVD